MRKPEETQEMLVKYAIENRDGMDNRQWDCLMYLIGDGTIKTLEQLKEYV